MTEVSDDAALVERLRRLVDNQTGGDAVVLVQRQLFNRVVGRLAALAARPKPRVKALTWRVGYCDDAVNITQASAMGGVYQVRETNDDVWLDMPGHDPVLCRTATHAVSLANEDHEARILATLEDGQ